jgi:hypothetical protein
MKEDKYNYSTRYEISGREGMGVVAVIIGELSDIKPKRDCMRASVG